MKTKNNGSFVRSSDRAYQPLDGDTLLTAPPYSGDIGKRNKFVETISSSNLFSEIISKQPTKVSKAVLPKTEKAEQARR